MGRMAVFPHPNMIYVTLDIYCVRFVLWNLLNLDKRLQGQNLFSINDLYYDKYIGVFFTFTKLLHLSS